MTITVYRAFNYRLLPSRKQHRALGEICESQRQLYNAALQERISFYSKTGKGRSYEDQCKALTELRKDPEFAAFPTMVQRWTLRRLDEAFKAFFDRLKRGEKPGFPRFRSQSRWDCFGFNECEGRGISFDGNRIRFKNLPGSLRMRMHRALPQGATIKSCVFRRDAKGWYICLQCAVPLDQTIHEGRNIGIQMGNENFATLSTGSTIPSPQVARKIERELRRRHRAWKRCRRGSRGRRKAMNKVTRLQRKIANRNRTFLHQQSASLARTYRLIAVEDLKNSKQPLVRQGARSAAAWGNFLNMLTYKAESAGGEVIRVRAEKGLAPCPSCGASMPGNPRGGAMDCQECGMVIDCDRAAALRILHLAVTGRRQGNVAADRKRSAGNLSAETEQS